MGALTKVSARVLSDRVDVFGKLKLPLEYFLVDFEWNIIEVRGIAKHKYQLECSDEIEIRKRIRVFFHSPDKHLVIENTERPPVDSLVMTFTQNYFRCKILRCSTKSERAENNKILLFDVPTEEGITVSARFV